MKIVINNQEVTLEVTSLRNGKEILIGFDNYPQAVEVAGIGNVYLFSKRDGQEWKEVGVKYEPLTSEDYLKDLGDNYSEVSLENEIEFVKSEIPSLIENSEFEKAKSLIEYLIEIETLQNDLGEDEVIIKGESFEVVKKEMMSYHEDVTGYAIGVYNNYSEE